MYPNGDPAERDAHANFLIIFLFFMFNFRFNLNRLFRKKIRAQLGIDLGKAAIKIVEIAKKDERPYLANYAIAQPKFENLRLAELKNVEVAEVLKDLLTQAQFSSRLASISLPVERTFSTIMDIPPMPEKEIAAAIPFEAQKYVPVPIDEVVLDWSIIPKSVPESTTVAAGQSGNPALQKSGIQVMVVAVPKEIIDNLTQIAKLAGLELLAMEQEAFSLARALVGSDSGIYLIADFGRRGTDLIVVEQGLVKLTHSLEMPTKEVVLMEIDRIASIYQMRYNKKVGQCLLTGGHVAEKETADYLTTKLKIPAKIGEPLARIGHAIELDSAAQELGLQLAVPIGLAMRE